VPGPAGAQLFVGREGGHATLVSNRAGLCRLPRRGGPSRGIVDNHGDSPACARAAALLW
jgi:hypothetical protein